MSSADGLEPHGVPGVGTKPRGGRITQETVSASKSSSVPLLLEETSSQLALVTPAEPLQQDHTLLGTGTGSREEVTGDGETERHREREHSFCPL